MLQGLLCGDEKYQGMFREWQMFPYGIQDVEVWRGDREIREDRHKKDSFIRGLALHAKERGFTLWITIPLKEYMQEINKTDFALWKNHIGCKLIMN